MRKPQRWEYQLTADICDKREKPVTFLKGKLESDMTNPLALKINTIPISKEPRILKHKLDFLE